MKKYFIVTAKCGHVGKDKYILIDFPVIAEDGREAAKIARNIPRVKHHHKDAIRNVKEVSYENFVLLCKFNKNDDYLNCSSNQEQLMIYDEIESRLFYEEEKEVKKKESDSKWFHKIKVRNYKKYMINYGGSKWKHLSCMNGLMN